MNTKQSKHIHVFNLHVIKRASKLLKYVIYKMCEKTLMIMKKDVKYSW